MLRALAITMGALVILALAVVAIGVGVRSLMTPVVDGIHHRKGQDFALIERGRYLTAVADCASCHTIPGEGRPFAGGRRIETPFGFVAAANITPDAETGIGTWTDGQFDAAVRQGERRDGKPLYPAMPFPYYSRMSREDVLAIRAYLDTVAPVRNPVTSDLLPFPLSIRAGMLAWDALYFRPGEFRPEDTKSPEWNRGAYLVEGPGHCGACHTPKTWLGGDENAQKLRGSVIQGWFAPNITNDSTRGLGRWSPDDIVEYLRDGHNRLSAATGPMAEEIALSSSHMTDADLYAIAAYLKDQRGGSEATPPARSDESAMAAGGAIYRDVCSACHTPDGRGVPYLFPALAASPSVRSSDPTTLIRIVLRGARSIATAREPTGPGMPAFGWQLDDSEVAAVLTYIRNSWGAAAAPVTADEVHKARTTLAARSE